MTLKEIDIMFPPSYGGNAQISDLRQALSMLVKDGNIGGPGSGNGGELEKIYNNQVAGWALRDDPRAHKGPTGERAVDFSLGSRGTNRGAVGDNSFTEGKDTRASGKMSHAEGYANESRGDHSHAEGAYGTASGNNSHAEGSYGTASGISSHVEGNQCTSSATAAHAEGDHTEASAYGSHAEGDHTKASGKFAHAEGSGTVADHDQAHAEGEATKANASNSHAEGYYTIAQNDDMHAAGSYNVGTEINTIHETGIGTADNARKNAFEIYTDGRVRVPELTNALVDNDRSVITKEYADANYSGAGETSELKKITEGGNTGWTLLGDDRDLKSDIGAHAIDLTRTSGGGNYGAVGDGSVALGVGNLASGDKSLVSGYECVTSGTGAFAFGYRAHAMAASSCAFGSNIKAPNHNMLAFGKYNVGTDTGTILEIGAGTADNSRANILEMFVGGYVGVPNCEISDIENYGYRALVTKEYADTKIKSDTTQGGAGSIKVDNIVKITQDDYDDLDANNNVDADTVYIII